MCSVMQGLGAIFDPANITGLFGEQPKTPKIDIPDPVSPSAAALQNMSSVGTGSKVQLGKQEKAQQLTKSGTGRQTGGGSALGGLGRSAGLRI